MYCDVWHDNNLCNTNLCDHRLTRINKTRTEMYLYGSHKSKEDLIWQLMLCIGQLIYTRMLLVVCTANFVVVYLHYHYMYLASSAL
jgi:hypothetical protein